MCSQSNISPNRHPDQSCHHALPPQQFAEAFPFHFVLNTDLDIIQVGGTLRSLLPHLDRSTFEQQFVIQRPAIEPSFTSLSNSCHSLIILDCLANNMQLQGQMMP